MSARANARRTLAIATMGSLLCACAPQPVVVRFAEQPAPTTVAPRRVEATQPATTQPQPTQPAVTEATPTFREPLTEPPGTPATVPEVEPVILQPPSVPSEPTEEQQLASLLADLQRYGTLGPDDLIFVASRAT
jgi:hypothetical protein